MAQYDQGGGCACGLYKDCCCCADIEKAYLSYAYYIGKNVKNPNAPLYDLDFLKTKLLLVEASINQALVYLRVLPSNKNLLDAGVMLEQAKKCVAEYKRDL